MARQATQNTVDLAVDATADLTALLNDLRLADGARCWLVGAGVTHGLWCLDKSSVAAPDGTTVIATLSGVGRWIFFGSGGGAGAAQLQANAAWNIGVLGGGARITTAIDVPGLAVGDFALASLSGGGFEGNFTGCELTAWVAHVAGEGAGTYKVFVSVFNTLGGGTNIGNVTCRVLVFKHA